MSMGLVLPASFSRTQAINFVLLNGKGDYDTENYSLNSKEAPAVFCLSRKQLCLVFPQWDFLLDLMGIVVFVTSETELEC